MVVCGVKNRRILYLLCLRKTSNDSLGWQHNYPQDNFVLEEQTNIRLLGQKLFDITYADGCSNLIAVDSKNRVSLQYTLWVTWSVFLKYFSFFYYYVNRFIKFQLRIQRIGQLLSRLKHFIMLPLLRPVNDGLSLAMTTVWCWAFMMRILWFQILLRIRLVI